MIIMLTMLLISSAAYMLAHAFGISPLMKFASLEIREVIVTCLVVLVFVGSFSITSSLAGLSGSGIAGILNNIAGHSTSNIFMADCTALSSASFSMIGNWILLSLLQLLFSFLGSFWVQVAPGGFGFWTAPLSGLATLTTGTGLINLMASFSAMLILVPLMFGVMMGLFYQLFPLFLYVGIALRSLPWTRAAGGAFIGLFVAFYLMFPFLLYFFIAGQSVSTQTAPLTSQFSNIGNQFSASDPFSAITSSTNYLSADFNGTLSWFIANVVSPSAYLIMSIAFSLIISLDFMEAVGDLLGSPTLSSKQALRGLL